MPPWIFLFTNHLLMVPLSLLPLHFLWIYSFGVYIFFTVASFQITVAAVYFKGFAYCWLTSLICASWTPVRGVSVSRGLSKFHICSKTVTQVSVLSLRWSWGSGPAPHRTAHCDLPSVTDLQFALVKASPSFSHLLFVFLCAKSCYTFYTFWIFKVIKPCAIIKAFLALVF